MKEGEGGYAEGESFGALEAVWVEVWRTAHEQVNQ